MVAAAFLAGRRSSFMAPSPRSVSLEVGAQIVGGESWPAGANPDRHELASKNQSANRLTRDAEKRFDLSRGEKRLARCRVLLRRCRSFMDSHEASQATPGSFESSAVLSGVEWRPGWPPSVCAHRRAASVCPTLCWLFGEVFTMALEECLRTISTKGDGRRVSDAARTLFELTQKELVGYFGGVVLPHRRREIWLAQCCAKQAARGPEPGTKRGLSIPTIKRLQAEAATGTGRAPLTVCFGRARRRTRPNTLYGGGYVEELYAHGDGCGRVHLDSTTALIKAHCDPCRRDHDRRRQTALEAAARAQGAEARWREARGEDLAVTAWSKTRLPPTCPSCGEVFETGRVDKMFCGSCRRRGVRAT